VVQEAAQQLQAKVEDQPLLMVVKHQDLAKAQVQAALVALEEVPQPMDKVLVRLQ